MQDGVQEADGEVEEWERDQEEDKDIRPPPRIVLALTLKETAKLLVHVINQNCKQKLQDGVGAASQEVDGEDHVLRGQGFHVQNIVQNNV